jgi:hypothetical protein
MKHYKRKDEVMFNYVTFLIILFFIFICQSDVFGQSATKPPPIRNYQEYRVMIKALNDVNMEKGLPPVNPLRKKEWEKLWPNGGPDAYRKQNPKEK